jgi:hypothetical protein
VSYLGKAMDFYVNSNLKSFRCRIIWWKGKFWHLIFFFFGNTGVWTWDLELLIYNFSNVPVFFLQLFFR